MLVLEPSTAQPAHALYDLWPGLDEYLAHYSSIDPRNAYGVNLPVGAKIVDYDILNEADIARNEFYQEYLRPLGFGYFGAAVLHNDEKSFAGIALQRTLRQGPFETVDLTILDRLAPHLRRALRLQTRFAALDAQRWADETLRDRLPFAVVLVDERGRIVSQNQAATHLLAKGDGLSARQDRLRARHPADQAALDRLIRNAVAQRAAEVGEGGTIALDRDCFRPPLNVFVMPIPRRQHAFSLDLGAPVPAALVIVTDPEAVPQPPALLLRRLYRLTPAECALAQALAAGRTLKEHAEEAAITCETARWRLKQVLAKTGTHRQAELVRLLLCSAMPERPGHAHTPQMGGAAADP